MNKNKPVATNNGQNTDFANTDIANELTNHMNFTTQQTNNQFNSRRDLLEQTKLSRLPQRNSFRMPDLDNTPFPDFSNMPSNTVVTTVTAFCVVCGGRLEADNEFQQSLMVCRKCLSIYAKIETAFDEKEKRDRKQMLEKMFGGAKR